MFDRETTPSFVDTGEKQAFLEACAAPIVEALKAADLGFAGVPDRLGNECDALAVDRSGRLLAIEVKPQGVGSVAYVAAQALMYARITRGWVDAVGHGEVVAVVNTMIDQRIDVGLASPGAPKLSGTVEVVPVVAIQRGSSPEMVRRMLAVRDVVASVDPGLPEWRSTRSRCWVIWCHWTSRVCPTVDPFSEFHVRRWGRSDDRLEKDPVSPLPDHARDPGVVRARNGDLVEVDYATPGGLRGVQPAARCP